MRLPNMVLESLSYQEVRFRASCPQLRRILGVPGALRERPILIGRFLVTLNGNRLAQESFTEYFIS
jgi:hypothetical protein